MPMQGLSWGPVRFAHSLPDPICFSDLIRVNASTHPTGSMSSGDDLLLLSNPSSAVGRRNLSIHASLDGCGKTACTMYVQACLYV